MKDLLTELTHFRTLSRDDASSILIELTSGKLPPSQISSFLTVFMMRPITIAELEGFRDAMLSQCVPVPVDRPVMDVCGTGGDARNTFNISTLSAFVVAACGVSVAKHGNYGVSSISGSSNVLETLGVKFVNDIDSLRRNLDQCNILFMHAPLFHPAMKQVAPVRKELGVKTFFNMLGPLVNPARPECQMTGVFSLELARQYAYLLQRSNSKYAVVHDLAGYDEISLTGDAMVYTHDGELLLSPEDLGLQPVLSTDLLGADTVAGAADLFVSVLRGEGTPEQVRVVVANAGLSLTTAKGVTLETAIDQAKTALESGEAYSLFKKFVDLNR